MSQDPPATATGPLPPRAPRSLGKRIFTSALKITVLTFGVACAVILLSWLNVMPGGWRVRSIWASTRDGRVLETFEKEAVSVPPGTVVFLGSSGIAKFPLGHTYPGKPWLNRGVGGEDTLGLLNRLDKSLPVARPAGIVLYGAVNDFRAGRLEAPAVVARMAAVVDAIYARFPGVPITLLEPLPQAVEPPDLVLQLTSVCEHLHVYARQHAIPYVRTNRPPLVDEDGRLTPEMTAPDGRHLNEAGYEVLAKWILAEGGPAVEPLRDAK